MKYVLEMNEEQAAIVQKALEFYARMRMGQWGELPGICIDIRDSDYCEKEEYMKPLLELARRKAYPELAHAFGHSYGVGKFEDADYAWETYTAIRHCRAWAKHPAGGWTEDFDKPWAMHGHELARCTAVKEANDG